MIDLTPALALTAALVAGLWLHRALVERRTRARRRLRYFETYVAPVRRVEVFLAEDLPGTFAAAIALGLSPDEACGEQGVYDALFAATPEALRESASHIRLEGGGTLAAPAWLPRELADRWLRAVLAFAIVQGTGQEPDAPIVAEGMDAFGISSRARATGERAASP